MAWWFWSNLRSKENPKKPKAIFIRHQLYVIGTNSANSTTKHVHNHFLFIPDLGTLIKDGSWNWGESAHISRGKILRNPHLSLFVTREYPEIDQIPQILTLFLPNVVYKDGQITPDCVTRPWIEPRFHNYWSYQCLGCVCTQMDMSRGSCYICMVHVDIRDRIHIPLGSGGQSIEIEITIHHMSWHGRGLV